MAKTKLKALIRICNLLIAVMYGISLASGNLKIIMADVPDFIKLLPLLIALIIEIVCSDRKESTN